MAAKLTSFGFYFILFVIFLLSSDCSQGLLLNPDQHPQCDRHQSGVSSCNFQIPDLDTCGWHAPGAGGSTWDHVRPGQAGPLDEYSTEEDGSQGGYIYTEGTDSASIENFVSVSVEGMCVSLNYATNSSNTLEFYLTVDDTRNVLYNISLDNTRGQWEYFGISCCFKHGESNRRKVGFTSTNAESLTALDYLDFRTSSRSCDGVEEGSCILVPPPTKTLPTSIQSETPQSETQETPVEIPTTDEEEKEVTQTDHTNEQTSLPIEDDTDEIKQDTTEEHTKETAQPTLVVTLQDASIDSSGTQDPLSTSRDTVNRPGVTSGLATDQLSEDVQDTTGAVYPNTETHPVPSQPDDEHDSVVDVGSLLKQHNQELNSDPLKPKSPDSETPPNESENLKKDTSSQLPTEDFDTANIKRQKFLQDVENKQNEFLQKLQILTDKNLRYFENIERTIQDSPETPTFDTQSMLLQNMVMLQNLQMQNVQLSQSFQLQNMQMLHTMHQTQNALLVQISRQMNDVQVPTCGNVCCQ